MTSEVIEKSEVNKRGGKSTTAITLFGVPKSVHKRMQDFQRKISAERGKKFTIKQSYVEFLKIARIPNA